MKAILFLLLAGAVLHAQEFRAPLRERDVPLEPAVPESRALATFDGGDVSLKVDPLQQKRDFFGDRESSGQQFRLLSRYGLHDAVTTEWETRGGIQRSGTIGATPLHPAFEQNVVVAQRATIVWSLADRLKLSATAQQSATRQNDRAGSISKTGYGSELSYAIWKEAKVRAGLTREETFHFQESIVTQDVLNGGFEQKLKWVPLTLASRASRTLQDTDSTLLNVTAQYELSGEWKPEERVGLAGGMQWKSLESSSPELGQDAASWFTQLQLKPSEIFTLTLRTAAETLTLGTETPGASTSDQFNLTVGTNVKLAPAVSAGLSVRYPLVKEDAPTRPYFSISASAEF